MSSLDFRPPINPHEYSPYASSYPSSEFNTPVHSSPPTLDRDRFDDGRSLHGFHRYSNESFLYEHSYRNPSPLLRLASSPSLASLDPAFPSFFQECIPFHSGVDATPYDDMSLPAGDLSGMASHLMYAPQPALGSFHLGVESGPRGATTEYILTDTCHSGLSSSILAQPQPCSPASTFFPPPISLTASSSDDPSTQDPPSSHNTAPTLSNTTKLGRARVTPQVEYIDGIYNNMAKPVNNACPFPTCQSPRKSQRPQDVKRHIETHYHDAFIRWWAMRQQAGSSMQFNVWTCCGLPLEVAGAKGYQYKDSDARVSNVTGLKMVGGCGAGPFKRKDSLIRHLKKHQACLGDTDGVWFSQALKTRTRRRSMAH